MTNFRIIKPKEMSAEELKKLEREYREMKKEHPELDDDSEEMKEWYKKYYRGL